MCGLGGRGGRKDAAKWACEPHGSVLSELHLPRSTQSHTLPLEAPHCMAFQRITSTFFPFCLLLWLSYLALNFWVYLLRKDVSVAYSLSVLILHSFSLSHSLGDRQAAGKKKNHRLCRQTYPNWSQGCRLPTWSTNHTHTHSLLPQNVFSLIWK